MFEISWLRCLKELKREDCGVADVMRISSGKAVENSLMYKPKKRMWRRDATSKEEDILSIWRIPTVSVYTGVTVMFLRVRQCVIFESSAFHGARDYKKIIHVQ